MSGDAFETIPIDAPHIGSDGDNNNNNNNNDDDDDDDDHNDQKLEHASAENSDEIPLAFVRESVPLCDLHRRIASNATLCARFVLIRCVDATCQAAAYVAAAESKAIDAKPEALPLIHCRFHVHGCPVALLLHKRAAHEKHCAYRPITGDDDDDDDDDGVGDETDADNGRAAAARLVAHEGERLFPAPEPEPEKGFWEVVNESDASVSFTRKSKELGDRAGEGLARAKTVLVEVATPALDQLKEVTAPILDQISSATTPMRHKISNTAAPLVENAAVAAGMVTDKVVNVVVPAIVSSTEKVVPVIMSGLRDIRDELSASISPAAQQQPATEDELVALTDEMYMLAPAPAEPH